MIHCAYMVLMVMHAYRCARWSDLAGVRGSYSGGGSSSTDPGESSRRGGSARGSARVPRAQGCFVRQRQAPEHLQFLLTSNIMVIIAFPLCIKFRSWYDTVVAYLVYAYLVHYPNILVLVLAMKSHA